MESSRTKKMTDKSNYTLARPTARAASHSLFERKALINPSPSEDRAGLKVPTEACGCAPRQSEPLARLRDMPMPLDDVARVVQEEHHALVLGLVARMAPLRDDELLCIQQLGDAKRDLGVTSSAGKLSAR